MSIQIGKRGLISNIFGFIIIFITVVLFGKVFMMGGEMYTKEGEILSIEINKELIAQGFCKNGRECNEVLEMYGGHGNHVNFTIFAPKNKPALAAVFKLIVERGIQITNGVSITVVVYPKSRNEYGYMILKPKSIIRLEIEQ